MQGIRNSPQVTKGTFQFPKNGLAGVVKYKFPTSGEWEVSFMTCGEFLIPCTRGFAARAGISPSLQISMMGLAHLPRDNLQFDNFLIIIASNSFFTSNSFWTLENCKNLIFKVNVLCQKSAESF